MMEIADKPMFVPPRKRGSKSSSRSSSESLQMLGTSSASPQNSSQTDHRANRRLHQPLMADQGKDHGNMKVQAPVQKQVSPGKRSITYHNQPPRCANGRSDESEDLNSDLSDCAHINDSGYADVDLATERSALNSRSMSSVESCGDKSYVTMTGTIKRGRKKGQTMDMKVQMSREELDELEHSIVSHQTEDEERCLFGFRKGPHVFVLSVVVLPFVFLLSCCYSFYVGTMTWYNMLVYFSEKKTIIHKIFISPLLIILYPFLIVLSTLGLGTYAAFVQVSWHFDTWKHEIQDLEKGFYGWLCGVLDLEDCSPYEVVVLTEVLPPPENEKSQKSQLADTAL